MAVRREVFEYVHGFDEALAANFNDVDFCLRLRERRLANRLDAPRQSDPPRVRLARRCLLLTIRARVQEELEWMNAKWGNQLHHDPFYSPNLSLIPAWFRSRISSTATLVG